MSVFFVEYIYAQAPYEVSLDQIKRQQKGCSVLSAAKECDEALCLSGSLTIGTIPILDIILRAQASHECAQEPYPAQQHHICL